MLRIGHLDFLNVYPVYRGLELGGFTGGEVELVPCGPDPVRLNGLLAAGEIDAAPCSSALLLAEPDLPAVPGLCVASRGPIGSVILFSAVPVGELGGGRVLLPANSATSVLLLRLLASLWWGVEPVYEAWPGRPPRAEEVALALGRDAAAVLVIGDEALRARALFPGVRAVDLGLEWWRWTGHPMVFSLWLARRGLGAAALARIGRLLRRAARRGFAALRDQGELAAVARSRGLPPDLLSHYYSACLESRSTPAHRKGLFLFLRLARRAGAAVRGGGARAAGCRGCGRARQVTLGV